MRPRTSSTLVCILLVVACAVVGIGAAGSTSTAAGTATAMRDMDCGNFPNQAAAQRYFLSIGGPGSDPDQLDADGDGIACESLPCPCNFSTTPSPTATPTATPPTPTPTPTATPTVEPASVIVDFEDGVLYAGCLEYDYSYTINLPPGTSWWSLDVKVLRADGKQIGSDDIAGERPTGTYQSSVLLCGSDNAGPMSASGLLEGSATGGLFKTASSTSSFTLRRPMSQTTAALVGSPKCGKVIRIKSKTLDERPTGMTAASYAEVILQQQVGTKWKRVTDSYTDRYGSATFSALWAKPKKKPCANATLRVLTPYESGVREESSSALISLR